MLCVLCFEGLELVGRMVEARASTLINVWQIKTKKARQETRQETKDKRQDGTRLGTTRVKR
jgi:hypothetical protein